MAQGCLLMQRSSGSCLSPADFGLIGGSNAFRALAGPVAALNPWATTLPGVYLCSSATPPGPGVHGMAGYYAARTMLRREFGIERPPSLAP